MGSPLINIISLFLISNVYPFNYGSGKHSKVETHQLLRAVKSVAVWGCWLLASKRKNTIYKRACKRNLVTQITQLLLLFTLSYPFSFNLFQIIFLLFSNSFVGIIIFIVAFVILCSTFLLLCFYFWDFFPFSQSMK